MNKTSTIKLYLITWRHRAVGERRWKSSKVSDRRCVCLETVELLEYRSTGQRAGSHWLINLVTPCHARRLSVAFVTSSTACRQNDNTDRNTRSGHRAAAVPVTGFRSRYQLTRFSRRRLRWERQRVTSPTWPETYLLVIGAIDVSCDERRGPTTDCPLADHTQRSDNHLRRRQDVTDCKHDVSTNCWLDPCSTCCFYHTHRRSSWSSVKPSGRCAGGTTENEGMENGKRGSRIHVWERRE